MSYTKLRPELLQLSLRAGDTKLSMGKIESHKKAHHGATVPYAPTSFCS